MVTRKRWIVAMLCGAGTLFAATNANAVTLATVGTKDTKIGQTTLGNSGSANEENWIESVIGMDITYTQLGAESNGSNWEEVTDGETGDYAFDFGTGIEPLYYLVKLGGGAGGDNTHYLYDNNQVMQWGFLNLSDFGEGVTLSNIGIISHVGTSGGGSGPGPGPGQIPPFGSVPEPVTATMGVMAIAALSTMLRRRR